MDFVEEAIEFSKYGFIDNNVKVRVTFEGLICDAPAKSFALFLKGHTGFDSCSKCLIQGQYILKQMQRKNSKRSGRVCFPGIGPFNLKNDEDFARNVYNDFDEETILKAIPNFGGISSVPLDYMHLVLLGVVKKLISLWLLGPLKVRLSATQVNKITKRLLTLRWSIPSEFVRKPRTLQEYRFWKASELRTFRLYTGPVVLKNILPAKMYFNFIMLHSAVTILISDTHQHEKSNIDSAHEMLQYFVKDFAKIYGKEYVSHNVHNLLHMAADVKKYGPLERYSSFRFENYMSSIKAMLRKGDKPLEQIARRYEEIEAAEKLNYSSLVPERTLKEPHSKGPLTNQCTDVKQQYKVLKTESYSIKSNNCNKDSCILLKNETFISVKNIVQLNNNDIRFIGTKFSPSESLYEEPDSRLLNIHIMKNDSGATFHSHSLDDVAAKVWQMPCGKGRILIPLLHSCH